MRRGTRRGQAVADALRITVPDAEMLPRGNEPRSSPSTPGSSGNSPDSPDSPDSPKSPTSSNPAAAGPAPTDPVAPPAVSSVASSTTTAADGGPQTTLTPVPPERLTQTGAAPTAAPTSADPGAPVAPTSAASLSSDVVPGVVLPTSFSTSRTAGRQVSPDSTAVAPPSRPTGGNGLSEAQTSGAPQPMSKVGIGFGVVGAVGFLVGIAFLAWYFRKRFRRAKDRAQSRDFASAPPPAPASNRSDSRIINEMMVASYQTGDPSLNSYDYAGGYMDEKRRVSHAENEMATPARPAPAVQHGQKHSVSSWLGNHTPEMLNPLTARASMTSSAAGLKTPGLPRETEDAMPPMPRMDPRFQEEQPQLPNFVPVPRQPMPAEYYYPINPNPERAPPPPGRMSMARTETTTRTSGTWNTWGVEQHRANGNDNGWKGRLGL